MTIYVCHYFQTMNKKQNDALQMAMDGHNIFVTGGIGTGKTRTIQAIVREMTQQNIMVAVTASTGLASKQIEGTCSS